VSTHDPVTVVISRKVKPGREHDYEEWIKQVTEVALKFEGHLGMNIFKPMRAGDPYVIVYKFDSGEHLDLWLQSPVRAEFVQRGEALCDESRAEHVSGLESWFTLPGAAAVVPPPKWKMALVTGLVVFAMGQGLAPLVRITLVGAPPLLLAFVTTALMVALLTWVVMPRVTRLLGRWLFTSTARR
jgi:antibiotic biosynthesis monooxygenase (ABM) superfamily enzyme